MHSLFHDQISLAVNKFLYEAILYICMGSVLLMLKSHMDRFTIVHKLNNKVSVYSYKLPEMRSVPITGTYKKRVTF